MFIRWLTPILLLSVAGYAPAQPQQQGQLDGSPTVFSVLAAINAAGYDADLTSAANHPLRAAVRKHLAAQNIPVLPELKRFYEQHKKPDPAADLSQYISFALCVNGPPTFEYRFKPGELPPDVAALNGFELLMARFHKEAKIDELWQQAQPAFDEAIARYHEPVTKALMEVNAYLRHTAIGSVDRRFQVYLDLLGAPNQIHSRSYAGDYFVVITPSAEPQVNDIRHAYLQYVLDPMAQRNSALWETKKALADFAQPAPLLGEHYKNDFVLLASASLVRAVESRLAPPAKRQEMVAQALSEGFILTPYFAEKLPEYEKQEQSMRLYYPELVKGVDLAREDKRLEGVQFATERAARIAKPAPPPQEPTGAAKTLADAEDLYRARDLEKAKGAYLRVLQEADERRLHASAYYGLARISLLQNDPESAQELFGKALQSEPEPQVKAWCLVYLARLSEALAKAAEADGRSAETDLADAARYYREALGVEGASDAARQAAQQGLGALESKKARP
ncbi:MAG: hypothetical protein IRZ15_08125 [Bryobacteraceae bacterium]|nr:hypothetical protein [Bryobacteraceae bacterium]